jgi:hypothetical protein
MSIICKLFGHNKELFDVSQLVVSGANASATLTSVCQRCGLIHRQGAEIDATNVLSKIGDAHLALSSSNDLIKSVYAVASRSGRTTKWKELEDKCVDTLLDNEKLLNTGLNPLEQTENTYLKNPKAKNVLCPILSK